MRILQPEGWAQPKGYSNGITAEGRLVFVAGIVGWNAREEFESDSIVDQIRQALINIVTILKEADAGPEHVVRMTWYITDSEEYLSNLKEIGAVYREIMGKNYPCMACLQIAGFIEDRARIEIETTAVVPTTKG